MSNKDDKKENILTEFFDKMAEEISSMDINEEHLGELMERITKPQSVAASVPEKKPIDVLNEQIEMGGRILTLIPFDSTVESASGFVSILGNQDTELPVLTLCVAKPNGGCIVSAVVFPSNREYSSFSEKLYVDCIQNFHL